MALRIKGEGEAEMLGFYEAMQNHAIKLTPPADSRCRSLFCYNGARKQANLTPLLAILLHTRASSCSNTASVKIRTRVLTKQYLSFSMGIVPTPHGGQAQANRRAPAGAYPGERALPAAQLAMRWRMGVRNSAFTGRWRRHC